MSSIFSTVGSVVRRGFARSASRRSGRFSFEGLEARQLLSAAVADVAAPLAYAPPKEEVLLAGTAAPDFNLPYASGLGNYVLSSDTNDIQVFMFFATWSGSATQSIAEIETVDAYVLANLYPVTVNLIDVGENVTTVQQFLLQNLILLPTLVDAGATTATDYDVAVLPVTYVLNNGEVYSVYEGYSNLLATSIQADLDAILTTPEMTISDDAVSEADLQAEFFVTLSQASPNPVTVRYSVIPGTATADFDYTPVTGTLSFAPGETEASIIVPIIDDIAEEDVETFAVILSNPTNATIADGDGGGTIIDDDTPPVEPLLTIDDVSGIEGDAGETIFTFTVRLAGPQVDPVSVDYITVDQTAIDTEDYESAGDTLTFDPGEVEKTIDITVYGDTLDEAFELFHVVLSNPVNGILDVDTGVGMIMDDDPYLYVEGITVLEGNSGSTFVGFNIHLSAPTTETVTVEYATGNDTAIAALDFRGTRGTATFAPGEVLATAFVEVYGDTVIEPDETFFLRLTDSAGAAIREAVAVGTILDDGDTAPPQPDLSIANVSVDESAGTMQFTVTLSVATTVPVTFSYAASNVTATAGSDYTATTGSAVVAPGLTTYTIDVPILADMIDEEDETLLMTLSSATHATLVTPTAIGTITDDDPAPAFVITGTSMTEADSASGDMTFTVQLTAASARTISVNYATSDLTAMVADGDYQASSGTLTFVPGTIIQTIRVPFFGDTRLESDESFQVTLSDPVNATIATGTAVGTIIDDDAQPVARVTKTNGKAIPNGLKRVIIDFGGVWKGGTGPVRKFVVANNGQKELRIGTVVLPKGFRLIDDLPRSLDPGEQAVATIQLNPNAVATRYGSVRFRTSDPDVYSFRFNIRGEVVRPGKSRAAKSRVDAVTVAKAPEAAGAFATKSRGVRAEWLAGLFS